jgi:hypothetical protein
MTSQIVVGRLDNHWDRPPRGCSFGLAPVLMRVRWLHGEQLTPPARACSTPRARERTHLGPPLRARHRWALSCDGRRCKVGRSLDGTWTRHRQSPNGHRTTRRVSAVSVHRRRTQKALKPLVPVETGWTRRASWRPRHARLQQQRALWSGGSSQMLQVPAPTCANPREPAEGT